MNLQVRRNYAGIILSMMRINGVFGLLLDNFFDGMC